MIQILNPAAESKPDRHLLTLCLALATNAMMLATNITEAEAPNRALPALGSGAADTAPKSIIGDPGGEPHVPDDPSPLPVAPVVRDVTATTGVYTSRLPYRTIG